MLVCLVLALTAAAPAQKEIAAVESAYDDSEFEEVITRAGRLLKSDSSLPKAQKRRLYELSAFSYFYLGRRGPAEAQLIELFGIDDAFAIDRKKVTPELASFFDDAKARWTEAHKPKQQTVVVKPDNTPAPAASQPTTTATEKKTKRPPFNAVALIPFGIGQLALGDYAVGTVLLLVHAALAATNIALYWVRQMAKQNGGDFYDDPVRAQNMQTAQNVAAFTLIGVGVISFIDALALAPLRVASKNEKATSLAPVLSPLERGAALGVAGRF